MEGQGRVIRLQKYEKHLKLLHGQVEIIQVAYKESLTLSPQFMLTE